MHWTIGSIVYAKTRAEATQAAADAFERLVGPGHPFDYFNIYKDGTYRANSPAGEKTVNKLMEWTRNEFMDNLRRLKEALSKLSDEEAFSERANFDVRYRAYSIGKYQGGGIYFYDEHGAGIRTPEEVMAALTKEYEKPPGVLDWVPEKKPIPDDVWIVLADVHS